MITAQHLLLISGVVAAGLMAGLFFGWTVSVVPGTLRVDDRAYVSTMQRINVAIINPGFLIPFLVTPVLLGAASVVAYRSGNQRRALTLAGAAATYAVGVLGVTAGGNVPLNNALADVALESARPDELATARADYERPWNRWHYGRTAASVIGFTLATVALLITDDGE